MWRSPFKRKSGPADTADTPPAEAKPVPDTLGALTAEMRQKGYEEPALCPIDGIQALLYAHTPHSAMPAWIDPPDSPFDLRVLDCREQWRDAQLFVTGPGVVETFRALAAESGASFLDPPPVGVRTLPCRLGFPRQKGRPPEGPQFVGTEMEDLWNIYLQADVLAFVRTWTGEVRYRARLVHGEAAFFVDAIEVAATNGMNADLAIRQVDFLIKKLLLRLDAPAPLPKTLAEDPGGAALHLFQEYGRHASYGSAFDTTEYRHALNGAPRRYARPEGHAQTLAIMRAIAAAPDDAHRGEWLVGLRSIPVGVVWEFDEEGPSEPRADAPIGLPGFEWGGERCIFAYTWMALRVEPEGNRTVWEVPLSTLCAKAPGHPIVLDPGGPFAVKLSAEEAARLAIDP